jgi:ADP-ribosyl-[dinitrogen reductase] hydrolase
MLGVIGGDIIGSVYEFKKRTAYDFSPLFHPKSRITDDTICSIAIMDALTNDKCPKTTLREWCRRYFRVGGWGKRFIFWVMAEESKPYGSAGNGSAMRIASVGWAAKSETELFELSDKFTSITHDHEDGLTAAKATSLAVFLARNGNTQQQISERLSVFYDLNFSLDKLRANYTRTEMAKDSVPQALYCALNSSSYEDAVRNAVSLGGDADTQAAIAGGVAEAMFGIDNKLVEQILCYLDDDMIRVICDFYKKYELPIEVLN